MTGELGVAGSVTADGAARAFIGNLYDWVVHRRVYGANIWGIAVTIATTAVFTMLSNTAAWEAFALTLVE